MNPVIQRVAGAVEAGGGVAGQKQLIDIGIHDVGDAAKHGIHARTKTLDDGVGSVIDVVGVVTCAAFHGIRTCATVQGVVVAKSRHVIVAYGAVERVVEGVADDGRVTRPCVKIRLVPHRAVSEFNAGERTAVPSARQRLIRAIVDHLVPIDQPHLIAATHRQHQIVAVGGGDRRGVGVERANAGAVNQRIRAHKSHLRRRDVGAQAQGIEAAVAGAGGDGGAYVSVVVAPLAAEIQQALGERRIARVVPVVADAVGTVATVEQIQVAIHAAQHDVVASATAIGIARPLEFACAKTQQVGAGAAVERVHAFVTGNRVAPTTAGDAVVALAAPQNAVAGENIVAGLAIDVVGVDGVAARIRVAVTRAGGAEQLRARPDGAVGEAQFLDTEIERIVAMRHGDLDRLA